MTDQSGNLPGRIGPLVFVAAAAVLLAVMAVLPTAGLFSADSGPKYWQALAFAEGEGFPRGFDYPAAELDPTRRHIPRFTAPVDDRLGSIYPVAFPLLVAGPLAVIGDRSLRLVPWLAGVLAAWVLGSIASRLRGEDVTGWVAALALLATPLAFYSLAFWEHTLALALVVGGMAIVLGDHSGLDGTWPRWAFFGVLLGVGAWVRTEVGFLAPVLASPFVLAGPVRGLSKAAAAIAGFVAGGITGGLIQMLALGHWLPLHVTYHVGSPSFTTSFLQSRFESVSSWVAPHWTCTVATVVWIVAMVMVVSARGSRSRVGLVLALMSVCCGLAAAFGAPAIRWILGARPTEAFPFAAPVATWLVLTAFPVVLWRQHRADVIDRRRLLPVVVAAWLPIAVFAAWPIRSFEWGGRVFLPTVVLLVAVMASYRLPKGPYLRTRAVVVSIMVIAAIFVQAIGLVLLRHGATTHRAMADEVSAFVDQGEPVITDAYLMPLIAGRGWFDARYLYSTGHAAVPILASIFGRESIDRWTYGTVLQAPGARLEIGDVIGGSDGSRWVLVDQLDRRVGSRSLQLKRFRRALAIP